MGNLIAVVIIVGSVVVLTHIVSVIRKGMETKWTSSSAPVTTAISMKWFSDFASMQCGFGSVSSVGGM